MRNKTWTLATIAFALLVEPIMVVAGAVAPIDGQGPLPASEPETLALLAIGAVAIIVARWAKRK
jgi:hypothetical protein